MGLGVGGLVQLSISRREKLRPRFQVILVGANGYIHADYHLLSLRCLDIRTVFIADLGRRQDVIVHGLRYSAA